MKVTINIPDEAIRGLALGLLMNNPSNGEKFINKIQDTSEIVIDVSKFKNITENDTEKLYGAIGSIALAQIAYELEKSEENE